MLNIPNTLTFLRLLMLPVIVWLLLIPGTTAALYALGLYTLAAITDFLDGWVARTFNQVSAFGTFLDPISDKIFVCVLLIALVFTARVDLIGTILIMLIFVREFTISGLREFLGPKNIKVPVSNLAKWKTTVQMVATGVLIVAPAYTHLHMPMIGFGLLALATLLTWITALDYLKTGFQHMKDD